MDLAHIKLSRNRDFFSLRAPRDTIVAYLGAARGPEGGPLRAVVLDLQRRDRQVHGVRLDGVPIRVLGFPDAHRALLEVLTGPVAGADTVEVLLSRRTFDRLADDEGAQRIKRLDLEAGQAADDSVLRHLGAGLDHALDGAEAATAALVDQICASITVQVAQRYGGLSPLPPQRGALAPWQLRLARNTFDRRLDAAVSLEEIAENCGLSVSHFSRAFRRSTGLAPHRWLMQRRIEVAKDMMLADPMPLAQIAVACGFADQSHFTRTFASMIGLTPARWRTDQERALALA